METIQNRINYLYNSLNEIRRNITEITNRSTSDEFHLNHSQRFMVELYNNMYMRQIELLYLELESFYSGTTVPLWYSPPPTRRSTSIPPRVRRNNGTASLPTYAARPPPQPDMNSLFSEAIRSMGFPDLTPVRVAPTAAQISSATRNVRFGDVENPPNSMCPIRLETFYNNTVVTQIIHCRHCFAPEEFERWFENSVVCPVCRFDIRTSVESASIASSSSTNESASSTNESASSTNDNASSTNDNASSSSNNNEEIEEASEAELLTQAIGNLMTRTNTTEFTFDASNSMIIYDAIFRRMR
jgi:uncharacterized Zn finger protein (UPF0148 family)